MNESGARRAGGNAPAVVLRRELNDNKETKHERMQRKYKEGIAYKEDRRKRA